MEESPDIKKPSKGILKNSSSFDRPGASYRKSAKFDELNVLQTYHPIDKDYGHMKIEEPKTPYNYMDPNVEQLDQLDATLLAEKLRIAANNQTPSFGADDNLSDDEFPESDDEKVRRIEFERRRKAHYNEFEAVRLARKLIEEEGEEDQETEEEVTVSDESSSKYKIQSESEFGVSEEQESQKVEAIAKEQIEEHTTGELASSFMSVPSRPMEVDQSHPSAGTEN